MAEAYRMTIATDPEALEEGVNLWLEKDFEDQHAALLADLGKGVVRFAAAVFPEASIDQIYAQFNERTSKGRGPHFDIYNEGLSSSYPWLGVYNIAGTCGVSVAELPVSLAEQYAELYPKPNDAAHKARRHFGALVLGADTSQVGVGSLKPDTGLVLPQRPDGPHIVHEITPDKPDEPGSFIKMIIPRDDENTLATISDEGFVLLDELLTESVLARTGTEEPAPPIPLRQPLDDGSGGTMSRGIGGKLD